MPAGQNAIVAVMSYSGFDIEDATVMNKASLDRGLRPLFCVYQSKVCSAPVRCTGNASDKLMGPLVSSEPPFQPIFKHAVLDSDGIVAPSEIVVNRHVLVNKRSPTAAAPDPEAPAGQKFSAENVEFKDVPIPYRGTEPSVVEKVLITSNTEESFLIKLLLRQMRRPEVGDKFKQSFTDKKG